MLSVAFRYRLQKRERSITIAVAIVERVITKQIDWSDNFCYLKTDKLFCILVEPIIFSYMYSFITLEVDLDKSREI